VTLPGEVDIFAVRAYRDQFRAQTVEALVQLCQSRKFGRSNKGEIRRVEE
jgi:hypothetical protein